MSKRKSNPKNPLIFGILFILVGVACFLFGFANLEWDASKIMNLKNESVVYDDTDVQYAEDLSTVTRVAVHTVVVNTAVSDVKYTVGDVEKVTVTYTLTSTQNDKPINAVTVTQADGTLTLNETDERNVVTRLMTKIGYEKPVVTVTVPASPSINVRFETAGNAVTLGVENSELSAGSIAVVTQSGAVLMKGNVKATGNVTVKTESGSVRVNDLRANALSVETASGAVDLHTVVLADTENLTVTTTSGALSFYTVNAKNAVVTSGSGSVCLKAGGTLTLSDGLDVTLTSAPLTVASSLACNSVTVKTTSGAVAFNGLLIAKNITVDTHSAPVELKKLAGSSADYTVVLDLKSATAHGVTAGGTGTRTLTVTSQSGDVTAAFENQ